MSPEEKAELELLRSKLKLVPPAPEEAPRAGVGSESDAEFLTRFKQKYNIPPTPAAAAPASGAVSAEAARVRRPTAAAAAEKTKLEAAERGAVSAEDKLRAAVAYEVEQELPVMVTPEEKRAEVNRRLEARKQELLPPLYMGAFGAPPTTAIPVAPPREVPSAEPPSFADALKPQTRIGETEQKRIQRERAAGIFDDKAFNAGIADLPETEQQSARDSYEAYKAAFAKIQELNPEVSPEEIQRDLKRQIEALQSGDIKKFVDDPANRMGYTGDPLARALQRQVTTAEVPILEPGQIEFVTTLDRIQRSRSIGKAEADIEQTLRTQGVEITQRTKRPTGEVGPGGRPIMEEVEVGTGKFRPATEEEIDAAKRRARADEERRQGAVPFYLTPERDKILANIEASAKGGVFFQKEYPTGATVEGPVSWGLRAVFSPLNAGIGAVSEVFTPSEITAQERKARPALYRDASAAVYNVAEGRGFMGEIGDLYEYHPDPSVREYSWVGKAAGFAADLISFDVGAARAVATGAREGMALSKATRAAGEGLPGFGSAESALARGFKAGSKEFLQEIGLPTLAGKIELGDIRLTSGAVVGDAYRAADQYVLTYEEAEAAGKAADAAHVEALAAAEKASPRSKFVADARRAGAAIAEDVRSGKYFDNAPEFAAFRKVSDAADEARSLPLSGPLLMAGAAEATGRVGQILRPYLAAAVRETPELRPGLDRLVAAAGPKQAKLRVLDVLAEVQKLPAPAQEKFYDTIRQSAALQTGFKTIDRATAGVDPGRFVVRVTPNTFAPASSVENILEKARSAEEGQLVQEILKTSVRRGDIYELGRRQADALRAAVLRMSTSGTLDTKTAERMLASLAGQTVSGADMRALMYSVTDSVAEQMRSGFRESYLAPAGVKEIPGRGEFPRPSPRAVTFGGNVGFINSALQRLTDAIVEQFPATDKLSRLLTSSQRLAVEDAKRAIGALPKLLEQELKSAPGASLTEKVFNLLARKVDDQGAATQFWNNVARASVFSRKHGGVIDFLAGEFSFRDPFQMVNGVGRKKLAKLSRQYAEALMRDRTGAAMELLMPAYIEEVRRVVEANLRKDVMRSMHGVVDLKARPQEVALGAYFRTEADRIYNGALERIVDFEPETLGAYNSAVRSALRNVEDTNGRTLAGRPLAVVVAHVMRGGEFPADVEALLRLPGIKKWVRDLDASGVGTMPGTELLRTFGPALLADVLPTVGALSAKYNSFPAEAIADDLQRLSKGTVGLAEVASPLGADLGRALKDVLGKELRFEEFNTELGILAEEAANGKLNALGARHALSNLLAAGNAAFYNLLLYANPRFHGGNLITGPAIGYAATGSLGALQSPITRLLEPLRDPFGIEYDMGELYARALQEGAFKSQRGADIDPRFLDQAKAMAVDAGVWQKAKNLASLPGDLAEASDTAFRLGYMREALRQGKTLDEALAIGRRSLYDYGSATDVERKYIARNILFYNFWRNSIATTVDAMLRDPGRFTRLARLTQNVSKMTAQDEETWSSMRFYAPYDAGVGRMTLKFLPQANREGKILLAPNMPYYDAVYLITGLLSMPLDMVRGVPSPTTGKVEPGSSYVFNKLTPSLQLLGGVAGVPFASDVALKPGFLAPAHAALLTPTGLMPAASALFDLKARPAKAGEDAFDGNVYTMSEENFARYKTMVKYASLLGASRPFNEYGKVVQMWGLFDTPTGPYAEYTTAEKVLQTTGFGTVSKLGTPTAAEARAAEAQSRILQQRAREQAERSGLVLPPQE